jgi:hypothetical protein
MVIIKDIDDLKLRYEYLMTKLNRKTNRKTNENSIFFETQKREITSKLKYELDIIEQYMKVSNFQEAKNHSDIALWYIRILDI